MVTMVRKQSIIDDFTEPELSLDSLELIPQKYIHYWDFMSIDPQVFTVQAKLLNGLSEMRTELNKTYREYFTNAKLQLPDDFLSHHQQLLDLEYLIKEPIFAALLQLTQTKEPDGKKISSLEKDIEDNLKQRRMQILKGSKNEIESILIP